MAQMCDANNKLRFLSCIFQVNKMSVLVYVQEIRV